MGVSAHFAAADGYIAPPICSNRAVRDPPDMEQLHAALSELRSAAARLSEAAAAADTVAPQALVDQLEVALRELSVTCYTLGTPLAAGLSQEERRSAIAALHAIGGAVAHAARVCRAERRVLAVPSS